MIVNADIKSLEWVVAMYLSQDPVGMKEIREEMDAHSDNQRAFNLPSRLIAKVFLFRTIFANLKYAANTFSKDPEFVPTSTSRAFWQSVLDAFVGKYKGFASWHVRLVQEASTTGKIVMCTGREYVFERDSRGEWPVTQMYNYPVNISGNIE